MSRYIDADALKEKLIRYIALTNGFDRAFSDAPSIDIVRCKECKHRCTDDCPMCNECGRKAYPTSDDDFCSWGEREGE